MSMMPAIRDATADDAAAIAAIYNHYVTDTVVTFELEPVAADEMRRRMAEVAARGFPWRVGEVGGRIAGFAYVAPFRTRAAYDDTVESTVYLAHDACGHGWGQPLYADLLACLHGSRVHAVLGVIALPNDASIALHERLGFAKVAHLREVGCKFGRRIDVGYWELLL